MSYAQLFQKGKRYVAGANKPFIVSHARIRTWAEEHGFTNITIEARDDIKGGVPFVTSSDDWDTLVAADHLGPDEVIDLPAEPAWVVAGDAAAASSTPANPIAPANPKAIDLPPGAGATPAQVVAVYAVLGTLLLVGVAGGAYYVYARTRKRNPSSRMARNTRCKRSTRIQSILIDRGFYTEREARAWVQREGFRSVELDATPHTWRFRQEDPRRFAPRSFRTIQLTSGVHAIIACPRE